MRPGLEVGQGEGDRLGRRVEQAVVWDLAAGTELYLPVEVDGALFSVGDTHAAQGDGEVCGTAIESPMRVALQFELLKATPLAFPLLVDRLRETVSSESLADRVARMTAQSEEEAG